MLRTLLIPEARNFLYNICKESIVQVAYDMKATPYEGPGITETSEDSRCLGTERTCAGNSGLYAHRAVFFCGCTLYHCGNDVNGGSCRTSPLSGWSVLLYRRHHLR